MSRVRSKNTKPELALRSILKKSGITFKTHCELPGSPDLLFSRKKVAVFVNGCFWHGCKRCSKTPKTRIAFWKKKIARNRERDENVKKKLNRMGFRSLTVWEHELKHPEKVLLRVQRSLKIA